jgi:mannose/fructose/N-acetylgalactosamine-specific phosphotransferase system component IIB
MLINTMCTHTSISQNYKMTTEVTLRINYDISINTRKDTYDDENIFLTVQQFKQYIHLIKKRNRIKHSNINLNMFKE